nr:transmembrane domain-containing protein [Solirubrobacterales bacterium]
VPSMAMAHQGNPDYRSEITSVQPEALGEGLTIEIVNFDDHVRLVNKTGKVVLIKGYDGEPYARVEADGKVFVNLNSPAYYLNEDRFAAVEVPKRADAKAAPDWKQIADNGTFEWHDHRSHYMGTGTPSQVTDESKETKVFDYVIPIEVGGEPAKINGTLTWVGTGSKAPVIPFVILGLAIIAAIVFWLMRRRRSEDDDGPREGGSGEAGGSGDDNPDESGKSEAW